LDREHRLLNDNTFAAVIIIASADRLIPKAMRKDKKWVAGLT
jgi:hypothetical protein